MVLIVYVLIFPNFQKVIQVNIREQYSVPVASLAPSPLFFFFDTQYTILSLINPFVEVPVTKAELLNENCVLLNCLLTKEVFPGFQILDLIWSYKK